MRNGYNFTQGATGDKFTFTSTGDKGNVRKAVIFELEEDYLYSLVMGDLDQNDKLKNFELTGNNDEKKVLATVADIIEFFIESNPKAIIFITGITKRLTALYKVLLLKELNLPGHFVIEGVNTNNTCEPIDAGKNYEGYIVFRK